MKTFFETCLGLAATLVGAMLLVLVWYQYPNWIVRALDENLLLIKFACALLPPSYGERAEVALRAMLGADKALLFFEAKGLVQGVFFTLRKPF